MWKFITAEMIPLPQTLAPTLKLRALHCKFTITIFLLPLRVPISTKRSHSWLMEARNCHRKLPKNGESRPYSVRFCRFSRIDVLVSRPSRKLTAVLSIKSSVTCETIIAGMRFALWLFTKKIGFPGWPEPILDSVTGLGRQLRKGGLHQPPFSFPASLQPNTR